VDCGQSAVKRNVIEGRRSECTLTVFKPMERRVARLKHVIRNTTDRPQFVTFELSTNRYRVCPGGEIFFFYESDFPQSDEPPLIMDFIKNGEGLEIIIWSNFGSEEGPFLPNGEEAITDFGSP
jgi:hypothetical protein